MSYEPPPRGRLARLFQAADQRHVPLRTILVTVAVVVATYLAGKLIYRLRDIVLLMLVAGFTAILLNPAVAKVQQQIPRRGLAVTIVTIWAALVFIGLAAAFSVPLVNGITHLANRMPGYIASAQHGNGWIGHLVARYHIQGWVQRNTPKLAGYAQSLGKPALSVGKGAISLMIELFTLFVLVLLLLLEGPKMWDWTLGQMTPGRQATVSRIGTDVSQKVTGYMFGNLLTSLIAGIVVFVRLLILGVPFPLLWGLWVAGGWAGAPRPPPASDAEAAESCLHQSASADSDHPRFAAQNGQPTRDIQGLEGRFAQRGQPAGAQVGGRSRCPWVTAGDRSFRPVVVRIRHAAWMQTTGASDDGST